MFSREMAKTEGYQIKVGHREQIRLRGFCTHRQTVWRNSTRKPAPYRSKQIALKGPVGEWDKAIDSQGSRFIFRKAINVLQPETDAGILHLPPIPA